jgi:hypothetical protein
MSSENQKINAMDTFNDASLAKSNRVSSKPVPFSLRLSKEERDYLNELSGAKPLGAYIREKLLSDKVQKRRSVRKAHIDEQQFAQLLSSLGASRLTSNLNQLAYHANIGTLDVSDEIEEQLNDAYKAVMEMRSALLSALGLKEKVNP